MNDKFFLVACLVVLLVFCVADLFDVVDISVRKDTLEGFGIISTPECMNLSGISVVACEVESVKEFYKYNVTPDNVSLSDEELKLRGGDCKNWAEYYIRLFEGYGFRATMEKITVYETNDTTYLHDFIIVNDKDFYCIVDQRHYKCFTIGGYNDSSI